MTSEFRVLPAASGRELCDIESIIQRDSITCQKTGSPGKTKIYRYYIGDVGFSIWLIIGLISPYLDFSFFDT